MHAIRLTCCLLVACVSAPPSAPPTSPAAPPPRIEHSVPVGLPQGYIEMKPERVVQLGDSGALLLVNVATNSALPIFIGGTEAMSIDGRLRGQPPTRPLTHDLLDHVLRELHASLIQVQVDELRDTELGGVFIGSIYLRANGRVLRLDARPSDAIALAIGDGVPIYVAQQVLHKAGLKWDEVQQQLNSQAPNTST